MRRRIPRSRATRKPGKSKAPSLRRRLDEALAREAASAEILKVIAGSPSDVQPVFEAIVRNVQRLFGTRFVGMFVPRNGQLEIVAFTGEPEFKRIVESYPRPMDEQTIVGKAMLDRRVLQLAPIVGNPATPPGTEEYGKKFGYDSIIAAPLICKGAVIGGIGAARRDPIPFDERQIALIKSFADQAVIAIENARLFNETKEALEQQTATGEILQAIASSVRDVQPVFDAIVRSAARLCNARFIGMYRYDGTLIHFVASHGMEPDAVAALRRRYPQPPEDESLVTLSIRDRRVTQVLDFEAEPDAPRGSRAFARSVGGRSQVVVPLLREGVPIGAIALLRVEAGPFPESELALLRTFADQAVIAIENARLFNETKESLERETATAEILRVMSSSPSEVQPVFDAVARKTSELCNGNYAIVVRFDGELIHLAAQHNARPGAGQPTAQMYPRRPGRETPSSRSILERAVVHIPYADKDPHLPQDLFRRVGAGSFLSVPLLRDGKAIGAIGVSRAEAGPFPARQIELVKLFADQAMIAIENTRLFNETKEGLERQTATSELLKVIGQSTTDVQPVFDTLAENAVKVCQAGQAFIFRFDGQFLRVVASFNVSPELRRFFAENPIAPGRGTVAGRAAAEGRTIHVHDVRADPEYGWTPHRVDPIRTVLTVPVVRAGEVLGVIGVNRPEVRPFSEHQIELLQTFADQAVIAIENVRLFNETKEALERQTATAEVLKVIAGSPADTQPVFDAILKSAVTLCGAELAGIFPFDGTLLHLGATHNWSKEALEYFSKIYPSPPSPKLLSGRTILARSIVEIPDAAADPDYDPRSVTTGHWRRMLGAPMLREGRPLGALVVAWRDPGETPPRQVELLQTFADQAAIAIENVRLFNQTKEALEKQTATAEILGVISGTPTETQPVFEAIVRRATKLCEAAYANVFRYDGERLLFVTSDGWPPDLLSALQGAYPRKPDRTRAAGRVVIEKQAVRVEDTRSDPDYDRDLASKLRYRRMLGVPLMRFGDIVGVITVGWVEPGPIEPRHEELLKTFAAQAVIAIENVRLFNETKEALEKQTATAEILGVISGAPTDTQPVFEAIVRRATKLCDAVSANVFRYDGEQLHWVSTVGWPPDILSAAKSAFPAKPNRLRVAGRVVLEKRAVRIEDTRADAGYDKDLAGRLHYRRILGVPLMRFGDVVGVITVGWAEPGPIEPRHEELLKTFAAQAVIAIENVRLFNETKEALEQQTATAEILKVISGTPTDAQPVFDAIAKSALHIFGGMDVGVGLVEGDAIQIRAGTLSYAGRGAAARIPLDRDSYAGRAILDRTAFNVADAQAPDAPPVTRERARMGGWRSIALVPMLREGIAIGHISVHRSKPVALDAKQFALLQTFADQAVIAIENVRLFNETKEALEQQTAISEVLRVISGSPADVQPVLEAVAERAVRICQATDARIFLVEGDKLRYAAGVGDVPHPAAGELRNLDRGLVMGRAVIDRQPVHIEDLAAVSEDEWPQAAAAHRRFGHRTTLAVPLLRERQALGAILLRRLKVRPFSEKQIALLKTFADQAAIAIENVRLFNETKEALERQTATAEVLKTISRSTFDLNTVLQALLDNAARLGGAEQALMLRPDAAGNYLPAFAFNWSEAVLERLRERPIRPGRDSTNGRVLLERRPIHIADVLADPEYGRQDLINIGGYRAVLSVPMLRDGEAIGLISLSSKAPFTEKQMEVVTSFADQAVIAIENVRLFNETKEALDQQKASADVLSVISSSIADTTPVFEKILDSCQRLFAGRTVGISVAGDDAQVHLGAYKGYGRAEFEAQFPVPLSMESGSGAAILQRQVVHYPDCEASGVPEYARMASRLTGNKSLLFAPMLWEGRGVGAIFVGRSATGLFSEKEIALLRTFADQAAIAIQNAKLFREIQEKSAQLEVANKHKSDFLANMSHELRTPLNAIIGFSEALIDRMFGEINEKQAEYLKDIHESGRHLLSLINDILDLSKIEAGRMELDVSSFDLPAALSNAMTLVRERAQRHGIDVALEVDKSLGAFSGDERKFKQIMLNLLSNAVKFTPDGGRVTVTAKQDTTCVEIAVKDTGIGIAPEDQAAVFEEFKQVGRDHLRKAEGTGLGLPLTKRFVELHGGAIRLESTPGKGSTFTVSLPLRQ